MSTPENQLNSPEDFDVLPYPRRRLTYQFRLGYMEAVLLMLNY